MKLIKKIKIRGAHYKYFNEEKIFLILREYMICFD